MEKNKTNNIETIKKSCIDTANVTTKEWTEKCIKTNLTSLYDWMEKAIKETISDFASKDKKKTRDFIRDTIFQGIEIGENNKERSLIMAMRDAGISEESILQIVKNSRQYLVTRESIEKESQ